MVIDKQKLTEQLENELLNKMFSGTNKQHVLVGLRWRRTKHWLSWSVVQKWDRKIWSDAYWFWNLFTPSLWGLIDFPYPRSEDKKFEGVLMRGAGMYERTVCLSSLSLFSSIRALEPSTWSSGDLWERLRHEQPGAEENLIEKIISQLPQTF